MKKLTFWLCLLVASLCLHAQQLDFHRQYGGLQYDDARSIVASENGCFTFTGLNKSNDDPAGDMYLTKINAAGAVLWEKFYGLPEEDGGNFLLRTSDGGYLISGHTANTYGEKCDGYVVKTDKNGTEEWRQFIGYQFDDVCNGAVQMDDGSYFLTGRIQNTSDRTFDALLSHLSAGGKHLFTKALPAVGNEYGKRIISTADGNLLIIGYKDDGDQYTENAFLLKCDFDGNVLWMKNIDTGIHERAYAALLSPDGNYLIAGGTAHERNLIDHNEMLLLKISSDGDVLLNKTYSIDKGFAYAKDIAATANQSYVLTGFMTTTMNQKNQAFILEINDHLDVIQEMTISSNHSCQPSSVFVTTDGAAFLAGKSKGDNYKDTNAFIARTNLRQTLSTSDERSVDYTLFPNPFHQYTYLKFSNSTVNKTINLFHSNGQKIKTIPFPGEELFIPRCDMAPGMYWLEITGKDGEILTSGNFIVE